MSPADPGPAPEPGGGPARPPWALTTAVRLGVVGGVLIVLGLALGNGGLALAGTAAGTLSLISVLIWRSQLIQAWRRAKAGASADAVGGDAAGPLTTGGTRQP